MLEFDWAAMIGGRERRATTLARFGAVWEWAVRRSQRADVEDASGSDGEYHERGSISSSSDTTGSECEGGGCGLCAPPIPVPDEFHALQQKLWQYQHRAQDAADRAAKCMAVKLSFPSEDVTCKLIGQRLCGGACEPDPISWAPCAGKFQKITLVFKWSLRIDGGSQECMRDHRLEEVLAAGLVPVPVQWEKAAHTEAVLREAARAAERTASQYCPVRSLTTCKVLGKPRAVYPAHIVLPGSGAHAPGGAPFSHSQMLAACVESETFLVCGHTHVWDAAHRGTIDRASFSLAIVPGGTACLPAKRVRKARKSSAGICELAATRPAETDALIAVAGWHAELERANHAVGPRVNVEKGVRGFVAPPWQWDAFGCSGDYIWLLWTVHRYADDPRDIVCPSRTKYFLCPTLLSKAIVRAHLPVPDALKAAPLDRQQPHFVPGPIYFGKRSGYMVYPDRDADVPRGALKHRKQQLGPNDVLHHTPLRCATTGSAPNSGDAHPASTCFLEPDSESDSSHADGDWVAAAESEHIDHEDEILTPAQQSIEDEIEAEYTKQVYGCAQIERAPPPPAAEAAAGAVRGSSRSRFKRLNIVVPELARAPMDML